MDAVAQVVKDIIDMKLESDNLVEGDEYTDLFDHYEYCLYNNNIIFLYRYGRLMGFMDFVRLPQLPKNNKFTYETIDTKHGGPILYILNCCVRDDNKHKVLWRLGHELQKKNKDMECMCWHDENGQLHIIKDKRSKKGANNEGN